MKNSLKAIIRTLKILRDIDLSAILFALASSLIEAVNPYIAILLSAWLLDNLTSGIGYMKLLTVSLAAVGVIFLLNLLKGFLNKLYYTRVQYCVKEFDVKMSEKTLKMDYPGLEGPYANDLRNRIRTDNNWGAGFYSVMWQFPALLSDLFGTVIGLVVLVPLFTGEDFFKHWSNPVVFLLLVVMSAAQAYFGTNVIGKRRLSLIDKLQNTGRYFGYFIWHGIKYSSGKDVRLYNASSLMDEYMKDKKLNAEVRREATANETLGGFADGLSGGLLQGGAYLFVVLRALSGALSVGEVVKFASTIANFANGIKSIMNMFGEFSVTCGRQQSTLDYLDIPDEMYKGTLAVEKRDDNRYEIEFKNVSFKYPGSDEYALRDFSIKLRIGERLAVVGMNGSGKTTMIKLLCRLYEPTEGKITLNGIDIRKYLYEEYLSLFSVVFQDFKLLSLPVGQNIAAAASYDDERVKKCLESAGIAEESEIVPEAMLYKDFDGNGIEISGGEAQKLALARALYKDAPFVVLDEPTAALDPVAEYDIYSRFNNIVGSRTAIFISHRLSSCRFSDDIAVFDGGRLVQRGSHDELLALGGKYKELWEAQAQYYK